MRTKKMLCAVLTLCMVLAMLPLGVMAAEEVIATGTINVNESLNVRKGPGTGYAVVGKLYAGDRVEIYEYRTVDDTKWGRIDIGWISMAYVDLDAAPPKPGNVVAEGFCGDDVFWIYDDNRTLTIYGSGATNDWGYSGAEHLLEPWLNYESKILNVVVEEGVTRIGDYAFSSCFKLENVYLPDSLTSIGQGAFYECETLTHVTIPDSVTELENKLFSHCIKLTSVDLPKGMTQITSEMFENCFALTRFDIPDTVTIIKSGAFRNCSKLVSCTIPDTVTMIGEEAFNNCSALTGIKIPSHLEEIKRRAFHYCESIDDIILPDTLTLMLDGAFSDCTSLTSINIPAQITDLYSGVFSQCTALKTVTFQGNAPENLADNSFYLVNATVHYPADLDGWTDEVLQGEYGGTLTWEAYCSGRHRSSSGTVTQEPTCTTPGTRANTCSICGESYTKAIPPVAHSYDDGVTTTAPTCTEEGITTYTCTACGDSYTEAIPALGHTWGDGVVTAEPTCTEDGVKTITCTACGDSYTEAIPALGHSYDEGVTTTAPTCTEEGITTYTCTACGDSYTESFPALGHSHNDGEVTQEPTCTVPGIMRYVCTVCGEAFTEEIPVAPHDYVDGFCSACGQQQLGAPAILSCYSKLQDSVKVTWTTDENAEGYELWRTATPEDADSWTRVKTINDGATDRYTNQGLTVGLTYYYKVRAFTTDAGGNKVYSAFSNVDYMPAAVVFDGPYSNATFRIRLRWNEVGGAHGYQIWRTSFDADGWTIVKTLGDKGNELTNNQGATTAYSNTGLTAGEGYGYRIRAFRITEDGRKIFGAYSDVYTVAVMPETPVVTGTSPKANRAELNWVDANGAAGYQVWMAESADGEFRIVKSLAKFAETYTKTDLTSGKTYYFKVRAFTEVDSRKTFGAYSEVVAVTVQ